VISKLDAVKYKMQVFDDQVTDFTVIYAINTSTIHVNFYHNKTKNSIRIERLVHAHPNSPFPLTDWQFRLLE
jgi:hypothetical protein